MRIKSRSGFTLTEIAIVLGVMGIVLSGIWTAASVVHRKRLVTQAAQQALAIVSNIRALYAGRQSFPYAAFTHKNITAALVHAGAFPAECFTGKGDTTPKTPWGTPITVVAASGAGSDTFILDFYLENQTDDVCPSFLAEVLPGGYTFSKKLQYTTSTGTTDIYWYIVNTTTLDPEFLQDCKGAAITFTLGGNYMHNK